MADNFFKAVNCKNDERVLECLQTNVTKETLEKIYKTKPFPLELLHFSPVVDREFLKDHPLKLFSSGQVKNTNILLGVMKDEMYFKYYTILWKTRDIATITQQFKTIVRTQYKNMSDAAEYAIQLYTSECTPTFIEAFRPIVDIASDFTFTCATRQEAILRSKMMQEVYLYRYSYPTPVPNSAYPMGQLGFAAHGADFLVSLARHCDRLRFLF